MAPPTNVAEAPAPTTHIARVSVKQYKAMKKVVRVKEKAEGRTLDYREAKKEFGKKVSWRRQFAASWKRAGASSLTSARPRPRRSRRPGSATSRQLHLWMHDCCKPLPAVEVVLATSCTPALTITTGITSTRARPTRSSGT